jgi:hypothetical protein
MPLLQEYVSHVAAVAVDDEPLNPADLAPAAYAAEPAAQAQGARA